ncbi:hypothetical protein DAPPUDRAFT_249869 [Daphnia pulex]|uniref:Uncharacterized protein n=1 Tax=Daphnia pulex TaxID=6669 RepID=E9GXE9_DAPPU|nr:hypothetical protein DAPPUDRAFT_249869 [Daphnia pulex]|eukprot:EFX75869.1 hypothetical protein DAPPUDRAFT_249869 [Daphnia pulex]
MAKEKTRRLPVGFEVPIIWKEGEPDLVNNQPIAANRFQSLLRRFQREPNLDYEVRMERSSFGASRSHLVFVLNLFRNNWSLPARNYRIMSSGIQLGRRAGLRGGWIGESAPRLKFGNAYSPLGVDPVYENHHFHYHKYTVFIYMSTSQVEHNTRDFALTSQLRVLETKRSPTPPHRNIEVVFGSLSGKRL